MYFETSEVMTQFKHINIADTATHLAADSATICDIRDETSFKNGHIEGAFHLTNQSMAQLMNDIDFDRPVIVVCYHGHSSQGAAQYLISQGFEDVYSLDGGFTEWAKVQPYVKS